MDVLMNPKNVLTSMLTPITDVHVLPFDECLIRYPKGYAVYLILFPNGNYYIGGTKRLYHRINQHRCYLRSGKHINQNLLGSYQTSKESNINVCFVELFDMASVKLLEQKLIDFLHSDPHCTNISESATTVAGECINLARSKMIKTKQTTEYKTKVSLNSRLMWTDPDYRANQIALRGESVCIDDVSYPSYRQASYATGYSVQALRKACKNGVVKTSDIGKLSRKVCVKGITYQTITDAAKAYNVAINTMSYRCQSSNVNWIDFNFLD